MLRLLRIHSIAAVRRCMSTRTAQLQDKLQSLCKRRGFVFPESEIYGGLANAFDFGHLGAQMRKNLRDAWWRDFISSRRDCVGLETPILMHPDGIDEYVLLSLIDYRIVWKAAGHVENFHDRFFECRYCHTRWRYVTICYLVPALH